MIKKKTELKYVGAYLDEKLYWKFSIVNLRKQLRRAFKIMYKLRHSSLVYTLTLRHSGTIFKMSTHVGCLQTPIQKMFIKL